MYVYKKCEQLMRNTTILILIGHDSALLFNKINLIKRTTEFLQFCAGDVS